MSQPTARRALYDALMTDGIAGRGHSPDRSEQATALIEAFRDEVIAKFNQRDAREILARHRDHVRRELLGDDLNPSNLALNAAAFRYLADGIAATMADQNEWDGDAAEEAILLRYVQHLAKSRDQVLAEAAELIIAENVRQLWDTKPDKHWAADLLLAARSAQTPQET